MSLTVPSHILSALEQEGKQIAPAPTQEPSSSPCTTRSYQGEHPAQSRASGLGTFADPGTPRGYRTGRAWTTPFSNRLLSSLWRKRSWSVPVVIPSICLFLLARASQPYNTWVYLKYSPTESVQMRPFAISPDCVAGCQQGKKKTSARHGRDWERQTVGRTLPTTRDEQNSKSSDVWNTRRGAQPQARCTRALGKHQRAEGGGAMGRSAPARGEEGAAHSPGSAARSAASDAGSRECLPPW